MKTLHYSIIVIFSFVFLFNMHLTENFQAFGDVRVPDKYNNTMRISIQSSPTPLNLQPPQDRQIHLRFFDANTNKPIENVVFGMNVTKGHQIFLYNAFYTKSGSFTLNLKPGERYLWSASPDHDPMDGLYYSQGDQIDIDTSYLTGDLYHFEFHPMIWVFGDASQQNDGIKFETSLNLLDTYNKTIAPDSSLIHTITTESPLKQFKSGIPAEKIECKQGLQLIVKSKDGSPACVKPETKIKLTERGWAGVNGKPIYNPKINPDDYTSEIDNKFFTLVPGTTFVYESKTKDGIEHNEVNVTNMTKVVMGVNTIQVWDRVWLDGELVEETFDWYAQDKSGNVWYFGEDSKEYELGKVISTKGSWQAGVDGAKPGIIMYAEPKIGQAYRQEYYKGIAEDMAQVVSINETVNVPFGNFDYCIKTKDWNSLVAGSVEFKYYCPEVGGVALEENQDGSNPTELVGLKKNDQENGILVTLSEGQREGPLLVQKIFPDSIQGLDFREYPLATNVGSPITLHVGDSASNGCTVELTLVKISGSTATFLKKENQNRPCPICLSENTVIDTPQGNFKVGGLTIGMQVWTLDNLGHKQAGTILKIGKTLVPPTHKMVHLILDDGRELFASAGHLTADGRLLGDLKEGDILDNSKIKTSELVAYNGNYTYDILPSGPTGLYWANGILLKSTIK